MTDYTDRIHTAVKELTEERPKHTTVLDDAGNYAGIHSVMHPPLLILLLEGTGAASGHGSSDPGVPIDANALEIWAQIRDHLIEWDGYLHFGVDRTDLPATLTRWEAKHLARVERHRMTEDGERAAMEIVESWVRMIERKFDPAEVRDWTTACPSCGVRRVIVDDQERFAIRVNVTERTADCAACGVRWIGQQGLMELRYLTNLADEQHAETGGVTAA